MENNNIIIKMGLDCESKHLAGAVSTDACVITCGNGPYGGEIGTGSFFAYVDKEKFNIDYANDIYYNENGAVLTAFDMSNEKRVEKAINNILCLEKNIQITNL